MPFNPNGHERTGGYHPFKIVADAELEHAKERVKKQESSRKFKELRDKLYWMPDNPGDAENRLTKMLNLVREWK